MIITSTNLIESIPTKVTGSYSNGIKFENIPRATVLAIVQRGYYHAHDTRTKNLITHAIIL